MYIWLTSREKDVINGPLTQGCCILLSSWKDCGVVKNTFAYSAGSQWFCSLFTYQRLYGRETDLHLTTSFLNEAVISDPIGQTAPSVSCRDKFNFPALKNFTNWKLTLCISANSSAWNRGQKMLEWEKNTDCDIRSWRYFLFKCGTQEVTMTVASVYSRRLAALGAASWAAGHGTRRWPS